MPELKYTAEGLPYYQVDNIEGNPLYTQQQPQSMGNSLALPVEYDPTQYQGFEKAAEALRRGVTLHDRTIPLANAVGNIYEGGKIIAKADKIKMLNKAFGTNGEERYQLWPEKIVREAINAPETYAKAYNRLNDTTQSISDEEMGNSKDTMFNSVQALSNLAGVSGPAAMVKGAGMVGGKLIQPSKIVPTFYSAVENAVSNIKQTKMSGEQWLGTIANSKGVKPEELEWTGLGEFLNGKKDVTKADIEKHLENNKVELKEVGKGGDKLTSEEINNAAREIAKYAGDDWGSLGPNSRERYQDIARDKLSTIRETTKYHSYQLPGGENYRETLLTLPPTKNVLEQWKVIRPDGYVDGTYASEMGALQRANSIGGQVKQDKTLTLDGGYKSSHWDEPNILAHIRMNDRTMPGEPGGKNRYNSLHLEEIQSDWGQGIRKVGYKGEKEKLQPEFDKIEKKILDSNDEHIMGQPDIKDALKMAVDKKIINQNDAVLYKRYTEIENHTPLPDMPFKKNWLELVAKRMIKEAAEKGYDRLSWTPGEAQAARYDLSKQVDAIHWDTSPAAKDHILVKIDAPNNNRLGLQIDKSGKVMAAFPPSTTNQFKGKNLADIIGKEHSKKILSEKAGTLKEEGLKIGGEGMHEFYDKMLPKALEKLGKEHGVKVKEGELPNSKQFYIYKIENIHGNHVYDVRSGKGNDARVHASFASKTEAQSKIKEMQKGDAIKYIDIPQSLKDQALHRGFPLFSSGMMLTPTENPFTNNKYKLVPTEKPEFE